MFDNARENAAAVGLLRTALAEELKGKPDARYLHRLHCVLLVMFGFEAKRVGGCFCDDSSTVARWVRHFRESGLEGLREVKRSGRPTGLSEGQMLDLAGELLQPPGRLGYGAGMGRWNGRLLREHLKARYDVVFSVRQCQRLLRQMRIETGAGGGLGATTMAGL